MKGNVAYCFKRFNKRFIFVLVPLLIVSTTISVYSILKPSTTTNQIIENSSRIEANYDFKATITPNVLYPNGGTIEVGDAIFKKITTAIPVNLKSKIISDNEVTAKGTHEVQLVVKAGDIWERSFPLEQQQSFELKGTEISIIDNTYKIDLEKVTTFIKQVEDETGIIPSQYAIEVVPNIQGIINYAGKENAFQVLDRLAFQHSFEEIKLAGEKMFTTTIPFTTTEVITNTFNIFGFSLPLRPVRISSTLLSLLLFSPIFYGIFQANKNLAATRAKSLPSQVEKINKKYGSRIIAVSRKINIAQKSIFALYSFKSILQIADDKELPIFFYRDHQDESAIYFIVDGDYLYSYETSRTEVVPVAKKDEGNDETYAVG